MWLDEASCEPIKAFLRHSKVCVIVSHIDGRLLWANPAFCEWSAYSLSELQELGWKRISVNDGTLEADVIEAGKLDGYQQTYRIDKQYIPKNGGPAWGTLSVMRWPASGQLQFCICTWEPLKNGTATAFNLAMRKLEDFQKEVVRVSTQVETFSQRTDEDKLVSSAIVVAKKYPKLFMTLAALFFSLVGMNSVVQLLAKFNLIPTVPVKVEQVEHVNK